jgi:hypothetical protein
MQQLTQLVTIQFQQEFQRLHLLALLLVVAVLVVLLDQMLDPDTVALAAAVVVYSPLEKFPLLQQMSILLL